MKMINLEGTYAHQLNKPANRHVLDMVAADKDKDVNKFIRFFLWLVAALRDTPAWNKPGTNEMLHKNKARLEATIAEAKSGKASAYRVAGELLGTIANCKKLDVTGGNKRYPNPGVPADLERFEAKLQEMLAAS
jgi:hypothetical protein